jgi:hypothetical protein
MKIISKRGTKSPPPTADGKWPFPEKYYSQDKPIDEEEPLSGNDEEVLRKTVPDYEDRDFYDPYWTWDLND